MTIRTIKQAESIAGSLGKPSKMPGYAYGLPAKHCPVGSTLVNVPGSVCSNCYALKGRYIFPNVAASQQKRFESLYHPLWVDAMVFMIMARKQQFFRWHDSGDLQGEKHLDNIVEVARRCPDVRFWLPTREKALVSAYSASNTIPDNLVIRVSGTMIDGEAPVRFINTSTVVTSGATCPAPSQGNQCGDCRACWDPSVRNVSYKEH